MSTKNRIQAEIYKNRLENKVKNSLYIYQKEEKHSFDLNNDIKHSKLNHYASKIFHWLDFL